jgi:hypothetical protein
MKIRYLIPLPVAALLALLGATAAGSAQSILLSASSFALLGGSAITNTGVTNIIGGDVGLFPTAESAITGIPPAVITGGTVIATGPVTEQAQVDFAKAAAGLAGMTSTMNLSGQDLGGMTLDPGVYTFDAAAQLTGTLTLDAEGENDAVWVFQIGTTLTTADSSIVQVINTGSNGGSDDGIFWDAESAAIVIGTNNTVLGNYLARTSITFDTSSQGYGRALAVDAISLDTNIVNINDPNGGDWTGGLTYNSSGEVVDVPEPAAFLWLAPLGVLGLVIWQRRGRVNLR